MFESERIKADAQNTAVMEPPARPTATVDDIAQMEMEEFGPFIRQLVLNMQMYNGALMGRTSLLQGVSNDHLRKRFKKKLKKAAASGLIAEADYVGENGRQTAIICLPKGDPDWDKAVAIWQELRKDKWEGELKSAKEILKKRQDEIDQAYEEMKKDPEKLKKEVINLETYILRLIDEWKFLKKGIKLEPKDDHEPATGLDRGELADIVNSLEKTIDSISEADKAAGKKAEELMDSSEKGLRLLVPKSLDLKNKNK